MHNSILMTVGVATIALGLAACGSSSNDNNANAGANGTMATAPAPANKPATGNNSGMMPKRNPVAPQAGAMLQVSSTGASMPYLTDSSGSALYAIKGANGSAACTGTCLQMWPPVMAQGGPPRVGSQLHASMLRTVKRDNGMSQISYNGHLLHRYTKDTPGGPPTGNDVTDQWGEWYLVGPNGKLLPDGAVNKSGMSPSSGGYGG